MEIAPHLRTLVLTVVVASGCAQEPANEPLRRVSEAPRLPASTWRIADEPSESYDVPRDPLRGTADVIVTDYGVLQILAGRRTILVVERTTRQRTELDLSVAAGEPVLPLRLGAYSGDSTFVHAVSTEREGDDWIFVLDERGAPRRHFRTPRHAGRVSPVALPGGGFVTVDENRIDTSQIGSDGSASLFGERGPLTLRDPSGRVQSTLPTRVVGHSWSVDGARRADWLLPRAAMVGGSPGLFWFFPDRYRFEVLAVDGGGNLEVVKEASAVSVSEDHIDSIVEHSQLPGQLAEQARESLQSEARLAETLPAYQTRGLTRPIVVGDGTVWIPNTVISMDPRAAIWDVFDADGTWATTLTAPPDFAIIDVGESWVWGVARDSPNNERVERREVLRPSPPLPNDE